MGKGKVDPPFLRTAFNYDTMAASDETALHCLDESRAQQSFAEEVDINTIVRRFNLTGELPKQVSMPLNADFQGVFDFHQAMNLTVAAREAFMKEPAHVRARFHNDPGEFVDFCSDDENYDEARKLGILVPKVQDAAGASGSASGGGTPTPASPDAGKGASAPGKPPAGAKGEGG